MAEVGVLELRIQDNAEQAAQGLGNLASAVSGVKRAVKNGLDLSSVSDSVKNLATEVNNAVGTANTVKNISTLFNSIANYSKLKDIKIDVEPFKKLKESIGDGIKIGQVGTQLNAMRQALAGEWNSGPAEDAIGVLVPLANGLATNDTANKLKNTAKALKDFSEAYKNLPKSTKKMEDIIKSFQTKSASDYAAEVQAATDAAKERWSLSGKHGIPLDLQQFGRKGSSKSGGAEQMRMDLDALFQTASEGFENLTTGIEKPTEAAKQFRIELVETKDKLESVKVDNAGYETFADSVSQMKMSVDAFPLEKLGQLLEYLREMHAYTVTPVARGTWADIATDTEAGSNAAEAFYHSMERTNEIVQNTAWNAGNMAEAFRRAFYAWSDLRSAMTLGSGGAQMFLGAGYGSTGETGWTRFNEWGETAEKGWTSWKEGAIEVEGTVTDAMDNIQAKLTDGTQMIIWTGEQVEKVANKVSGMKFYNRESGGYNPMESVESEDQRLQSRLEEYAQKFSVLKKMALDSSDKFKEALKSIYGFDVTKVPDAPANIDSVISSIEKFNSAQENLKNSLEGTSRAYGSDMVSDLTQNYSELDLMGLKLEGMKQALADDINANRVDSQAIADRTMRIQALSEKLETLKQAQEEATTFTGRLNGAWDGLKKGIAGMFPTLSGMIKRLGQIAKYRMLRSVLRYITSGFSEGIENVYRYSQAVGTSFAPNMDSAASAILQFKNSIGAAVAPVLQALIPVLNQIIDSVINVVNWINQLFALLAGQSTWTRALPTAAKAFDDQKKSAQGASKAMKDLLADWDELNIIQSETGGSGSGSKKEETDYASMFEEVNNFSERIKTLVDGINDQFGSVWNLVQRIGAAVLAWKVSTAFTGLIGALGGLIASGAIIGLVFDISTMFNKNFLKTGDVGWLIGDLLTTLIGGTLAEKVLSKVIGGTFADIAIPLTFIVSAAASIRALIEDADVSALSEKGLLEAINGGLKGGVAAGALLYRLGNYSLKSAVGGGAGAALFTFGATVGIKAIAEVVQNRELTADSIKENLLSAGAIGAGITIAELALGGTAGAALTLGGGAALFTIGALFAIEAIIASQPKGIKWGNYKATQEEIEGFVRNQVFTVHPGTILEVIKPVIEVADEARDNLTADVDNVTLTVRKIQLGYDSKEIMDALGDQVEKLINDFRETAKAEQHVIETGLLLIPAENKEDKDKLSGIIDTSSKGWDTLTGYMDDLGADLARHLKEAYSENISPAAKAIELETIAELTEAMINISNAVANGEAQARASIKLSENLSNLTEGSFGDLLSYVSQYKQEITDAYTTAYDNAIISKGRLVAGLEASMYEALERAGGDVDDSVYKEIKAKYEENLKQYEDMLAERDAEIKRISEGALDESAVELIRNAVVGNLTKRVQGNDFWATTLGAGGPFLNSVIEQLFSPEGNLDTDSATTVLDNLFDEILTSVFGSDYDNYLRPLLNDGILKYVDLIPKDIIDSLNESLGIAQRDEGGQLQWNDFLQNYMGGPAIDFEVDVPDDGFVGPTIDMSELNNAMIESTGYINSMKDALYSIEELNNMKPKYPYGLVNDPFGIFNKNGSTPSGSVAMPYAPQATGSVLLTAQPGSAEISGEVSVDEGQMANSVQKGMQSNTDQLGGLLRQLVNIATQIGNKDFSVKFEPTASAGYFWRTANGNKNRVDGEV